MYWIYFMKYRNIFMLSIISEHWADAGGWNSSLWKARTHKSCNVNSIVTDDLVMLEPGHQQPWHWQSHPNIFQFQHQNGQRYTFSRHLLPVINSNHNTSQYLFSWPLKVQYLFYTHGSQINIPDSKVHGANMGPTWVLLAPDGTPCWPHEPCY